MTPAGHVDIVDFVERTTYQIWNAHQPERVLDTYRPSTVIWTDAGDLHGDQVVVQNTAARQRRMSDFVGLIADTIWTGDEASGFRTSMRWVSRGTLTDSPGVPAGAVGRVLINSSIANCVVLNGIYVEEWGATTRGITPPSWGSAWSRPRPASGPRRRRVVRRDVSSPAPSVSRCPRFLTPLAVPDRS
ncbi:hypothetical protein HJ590_08675 [Naumannella sp. ID2617S]|nr:hypothetical protein [Naumannella sp. ID2617S]